MEKQLIKQLADIVKNLYIQNYHIIGETQVKNVCKELDELMSKCDEPSKSEGCAER